MKAPIGTRNDRAHCAFLKVLKDRKARLTQPDEHQEKNESASASGPLGFDASRLIRRVFLIRDRAGLRRVPVAFQSGDDLRATAAGRKFFGPRFAGLL